MKYIVLFDELMNTKIQRSDLEAKDDESILRLTYTLYNKQPGLYTIYRESIQILQFRINPVAIKDETDQDDTTVFDQMKSILRSHGIRMNIGGCSCCDSPWIAFEYRGEKILDIEGRSLDMFNE